jgi:anti-sigma factor (TIGR02949 family)
MMNCSKIRKNLSAYADGELGARPRRKINRHLAHCEKCAAELAGLEEVTQTAKHSLQSVVSGRVPPADLRNRIIGAAHRLRPPRPLLVPVRRLVAGAAIVALASGLFAGFVIGSRFRSERENFRSRIAELDRALALAQVDNVVAQARLVEARAKLMDAEQQLRLASAKALQPTLPGAARLWPPVLSSIQKPDVQSLLENGLL